MYLALGNSTVYCTVFQAVILFSWMDYKPVTLGSYDYPVWADVLGFFMSVTIVISIPAYAVYAIWSEDGSFLQVQCYQQ